MDGIHVGAGRQLLHRVVGLAAEVALELVQRFGPDVRRRCQLDERASRQGRQRLGTRQPEADDPEADDLPTISFGHARAPFENASHLAAAWARRWSVSSSSRKPSAMRSRTAWLIRSR